MPEPPPPPTTWTVNHQYFVHVPPKSVFEAFSTPEQLVRWMSDTAEIELRESGRYALGWKNGPTHRGTVLEFVPGRSVTLSWDWPNVDLHGTRFKLAVEPKDDGALFFVEHSGFPAEARWGELYGGAEWGWTFFAMNLKSVLETGWDLRTPLDG